MDEELFVTFLEAQKKFETDMIAAGWRRHIVLDGEYRGMRWLRPRPDGTYELYVPEEKP
jgi:hypothetical protein